LENLKGKGSAGYMNLLGSLIHNSMDGLALGVGFATGDPKIFVPILVAIIVHEIPR
jgi:zinc transporter ZupT